MRALMDKEGWKVSRKFVQKVRSADGLGVKNPFVADRDDEGTLLGYLPKQ